MQTTLVHIQLLAFWHPGTGRGQGPGADALVNRNAYGLPYLPGRTLKGLFRDAARVAEVAGVLSPAELVAAFGHDGRGAQEEARFASRKGAARFESARMGTGVAEAEAWEAWAREPGNAAARQQLFRNLASTSLNEFGTAEEGTLRTIEVVVPVPLVATISAPRGSVVPRVLQAAAPHIFAIGAHRTRGLGRCIVTVSEVA